VTVVVGAFGYVAPGLTADPRLVAVAFAVWGAVIVMWNVVTVSLRQRIVPDRLLGRVNASYRLLAWGSQPLGALLGGFGAELLGLQPVFLMCGIATALLVVARRIVTDEAIAAAEHAGEPEGQRTLVPGPDAS
jgi:hypothetical protein